MLCQRGESGKKHSVRYKEHRRENRCVADEKEDYESDYQAITDSVDLAEIYEKATKKLKMVQAESNQIYKYKNRKSDMVKQYADIPSK